VRVDESVDNEDGEEGEEGDDVEVCGVGMLKYCGQATRFSYVSFSLWEHDSSGGINVGREAVDWTVARGVVDGLAEEEEEDGRAFSSFDRDVREGAVTVHVNAFR
jgi:hypothetical protein